MVRARRSGGIPALLCVRPPPGTSRLLLAVLAAAGPPAAQAGVWSLTATDVQERSIAVTWNAGWGNDGSTNLVVGISQTEPTRIDGASFTLCPGDPRNSSLDDCRATTSWRAWADRHQAVIVQPGRTYVLTVSSFTGKGVQTGSRSVTVTAAGELVEDPPPTTPPSGGGGGGGGTPDPEPDQDEEPEAEPCEKWVTPYWQGSGGFAVRPADGSSAVVRLSRGRTMRGASREYVGDDGLIVRLVDDSLFFDRNGHPLSGTVSFEGIEGGGWYWVNGDRNVAVAPLVCESSFSDRIDPPIPGGVTASSNDTGTLVVHEGTGFMGVIPHLEALHGDGRHVAPYWKGDGGIVGRALNGQSVTVRRACGIVPETYTVDAGEDGLVVELVDGCVDRDGNSIRSGLEVDGFIDGAWYRLNENGLSAAAPLIRRFGDPAELAAPVIPGGVDSDEGRRGTQFIRDRLMGVVPRLTTP